MAIISRLEQVTGLRQSVTDLIETLEAGGLAQMEPPERLDLWQYLHAVRVRLVLAEQAMAGDNATGSLRSESERYRHLAADSGQASPRQAPLLGQRDR